jgi:hypothetical protein
MTPCCRIVALVQSSDAHSAPHVPRSSFFGRGVDRKLCPSAPARYRASIGGSGEAFMPEALSFPIFLRATMPQVRSPDTGEG